MLCPSARIFLSVMFATLFYSSAQGEEKTLLLIGQGPDGHRPETHEFMAGVRIMSHLMQPFSHIKTVELSADEPWLEGPILLEKADGVVLYVTQGARWMQMDSRRYEALLRLAERGGGIVALHWAVGAKEAKYIPGQLRLLGGTRGGPQRKWMVGEQDLRVVDKDHPITRGITDFRVNDEFYYQLDFLSDREQLQPLLQTTIEGETETACWAWPRPDGGRSFGFVCLHFHRNWELAEYQRLVTQAILWTLKEPIPKEGISVSLDPELLQLPESERED